MYSLGNTGRGKGLDEVQAMKSLMDIGIDLESEMAAEQLWSLLEKGELL